MLFLDAVYVDGENGSSLRFRSVKAPTSAELTQLTHTIAQRVARCLELWGLLERDVGNSYLSGDAFEVGPRDQLLAHIDDVHGSTNAAGGRMPGVATCRIAVGSDLTA